MMIFPYPYIGISDPVPGRTAHTLSPEDCSYIISFFESKHSHHIHENKPQVKMRSLIRPSLYGSFKGMHDRILGVLKKGYSEYTEKYDQCDRNFDEHFEEFWKIQRSDAGEGFLAWHHEQGGKKGAIGRYLVWMIYLNEDIHGGETEFAGYGKVSPQVGRLVIWPASFIGAHRGCELRSGSKYIMTGWWRFKENHQ